MVMPGLINLDFADIRTVMAEMGKAMMGTGESEGEDRARLAAEAAISNPLLDEVSMHGARGVLINITGGDDMTLLEVDAAANRIREEVDQDANIIFGATLDGALEGRMRVSIVATGIDAVPGQKPLPIEPFTTIEGGRKSAPAPASKPEAPAQVAAELLAAEEARAEAEAQAAEEADAEEKRTAEAAAAPMAIAAEAAAPPARTSAWTFPSMLGRAEAAKPAEAFIPSPAVAPEKPAAAARPAPQSVAQPAAAVAVEPAPARPRRTFSSLFDRMTGGRPHEEAEQAEASSEAAEKPRSEPRLDAGKTSKTEDYLDIPTFLRRQAN